MTAWSAEIVGLQTELIPSTIGELLARMVRRRWPRDTAKSVARAWDLDPKTAKSLTEGHASERTITKALKAEGWELLDRLGEAVTGQSYVEWVEAKHEAMIKEAELAKQNIARLRAQGRVLSQEHADHRDLRAGESPAPRRSARG
jgi:hypothetical protein